MTTPLPTNAEIAAAIAAQPAAGRHEHPDCVRIAFAWLDAQTRIKSRLKAQVALKHLIERWGGRYVSSHDVQVAAGLLGLEGDYPFYNLSSRFTWPDRARLKGVGEAGAHGFKDDDALNYARREASA